MLDNEIIEPYVYRDFYIPAHMMEGLDRYIKYGIEPGSFLLSVLKAQSLIDVMGNADDENLHNLPAYGAYLYNKMPSAAWGSEEKVYAWMAKKQSAMKEEITL
jgi:hypothetical protein